MLNGCLYHSTISWGVKFEVFCSVRLKGMWDRLLGIAYFSEHPNMEGHGDGNSTSSWTLHYLGARARKKTFQYSAYLAIDLLPPRRSDCVFLSAVQDLSTLSWETGLLWLRRDLDLHLLRNGDRNESSCEALALRSCGNIGRKWAGARFADNWPFLWPWDAIRIASQIHSSHWHKATATPWGASFSHSFCGPETLFHVSSNRECC